MAGNILGSLNNLVLIVRNLQACLSCKLTLTGFLVHGKQCLLSAANLETLTKTDKGYVYFELWNLNIPVTFNMACTVFFLMSDLFNLPFKQCAIFS